MGLRIKFNAPVTLYFSLLCAAILVFNKSTLDATLPFFVVGNSLDIQNPVSVFTLFSHVLGHANWSHLMGNLTFILLVGPIVEEKYGSKRMVIMIVLTALITGILNILFFNSGLLGASGVVFMLILLSSFTNVKSGEIPITFILVALLFLGKEILDSIQNDNISQFAHIIGGICGSFFGFKGK
jgi:membrane associated rhomboid family serine protease